MAVRKYEHYVVRAIVYFLIAAVLIELAPFLSQILYRDVRPRRFRTWSQRFVSGHPIL